MSITDTPSPVTIAPRPPVPANPSAEAGARISAAWQALGRHSAHIVREATHHRDTERLKGVTSGLFNALAAVGVPIPGHFAIPTSAHQLTERELQVLRGMSEGKQNAEIGRDLYVSEDTIKTHARRLFRKLEAHDRAHAVALGFRTGLLT